MSVLREEELVAHFHGSVGQIKRCFAKSHKSAAMVIIAAEGMSDIYSQPYDVSDRREGVRAQSR